MKRKWNLFEPGEIAGSVKTICVSQEMPKQKDTKYYTRTVCCNRFQILTHEQIYDRRRRGAPVCKECAKTFMWRNRLKKAKKPEKQKKPEEIIEPTAHWPAPQSQVGRLWYGRIQ